MVQNKVHTLWVYLHGALVNSYRSKTLYTYSRPAAEMQAAQQMVVSTNKLISFIFVVCMLTGSFLSHMCFPKNRLKNTLYIIMNYQKKPDELVIKSTCD